MEVLLSSKNRTQSYKTYKTAYLDALLNQKMQINKDFNVL